MTTFDNFLKTFCWNVAESCQNPFWQLVTASWLPFDEKWPESCRKLWKDLLSTFDEFLSTFCRNFVTRCQKWSKSIWPLLITFVKFISTYCKKLPKNSYNLSKTLWTIITTFDKYLATFLQKILLACKSGLIIIWLLLTTFWQHFHEKSQKSSQNFFKTLWRLLKTWQLLVHFPTKSCQNSWTTVLENVVNSCHK